MVKIVFIIPGFIGLLDFILITTSLVKLMPTYADFYIYRAV